jgi:hypothetical protein
MNRLFYEHDDETKIELTDDIKHILIKLTEFYDVLSVDLCLHVSKFSFDNLDLFYEFLLHDYNSNGPVTTELMDQLILFSNEFKDLDYSNVKKNNFQLTCVFLATLACYDVFKMYSNEKYINKIGNLIIQMLINAKIYN